MVGGRCLAEMSQLLSCPGYDCCIGSRGADQSRDVGEWQLVLQRLHQHGKALSLADDTIIKLEGCEDLPGENGESGAAADHDCPAPRPQPADQLFIFFNEKEGAAGLGIVDVSDGNANNIRAKIEKRGCQRLPIKNI